MNPLIALDSPHRCGARGGAHLLRRSLALVDRLAVDAAAHAVARGLERRRHERRTEHTLRRLETHLLRENPHDQPAKEACDA